MNTNGVAYAVIVTFVLIVVLALLRLFFKKVSARIEGTLSDSDWALKVQRLELLSAEGFKTGAVGTIRIFHTLTVLISR